MPRVMVLETSERCLMGAIIISMAVTNATKPPADIWLAWLCMMATEMTAESAIEAKKLVTGATAEPTMADFMAKRCRLVLTT